MDLDTEIEEYLRTNPPPGMTLLYLRTPEEDARLKKKLFEVTTMRRTSRWGGPLTPAKADGFGIEYTVAYGSTAPPSVARPAVLLAYNQKENDWTGAKVDSEAAAANPKWRYLSDPACRSKEEYKRSGQEVVLLRGALFRTTDDAKFVEWVAACPLSRYTHAHHKYTPHKQWFVQVWEGTPDKRSALPATTVDGHKGYENK